MRYEHLNLAINECKRLGIDHKWEYTSGNHIKLIIRKGDRSRFVFVSKTPGDHRVALNLLKQVRKAIQRISL
jgi:hypothetical protein